VIVKDDAVGEVEWIVSADSSVRSGRTRMPPVQDSA